MHTRRVDLIVAALLILGSSCDASRDKLLLQLQSARPAERAAAVRNIARRGNVEDVALFRRAAVDPSAVVSLRAYAREGDTLVVVRLDRLGRSLAVLLATVAMLKEHVESGA